MMTLTDVELDKLVRQMTERPEVFDSLTQRLITRLQAERVLVGDWKNAYWEANDQWNGKEAAQRGRADHYETALVAIRDTQGGTVGLLREYARMKLNEQVEV
jgi:hypothetical protein